MEEDDYTEKQYALKRKPEVKHEQNYITKSQKEKLMNQQMEYRYKAQKMAQYMKESRVISDDSEIEYELQDHFERKKAKSIKNNSKTNMKRKQKP